MAAGGSSVNGTPTTDGGVTFRSMPAPGGRFGPALDSPPAAGSIRFADPSDGLVFRPALYVTHDGGRRWTAISVPGQVTDLEPGLGEVFAVITPPAPRCSATGTCTSRTPAPQLWRARPSSDRWTADPAAGGVAGALAVHGDSVWLINTLSTRDGPAAGTGLLRSADGGGQFAVEPEPIPGIGCSYSSATDAVLWSYCSGGHTSCSPTSPPMLARTSPASARARASGRRPTTIPTDRPSKGCLGRHRGGGQRSARQPADPHR
ncbi:MAG TPA: hypothetical protein VMV92_02775 [Streptosporangiaceae bacterium]|nr:hypothetical protein [Streptosporangiaceae bacterium]